MITLQQSVDTFIKKTTRYKRTKANLTNLFISSSQKGKKDTTFAIFEQRDAVKILDKPLTDPLVLGTLPRLIKESVIAYNSQKETAINIYQQYTKFVIDEYCFDLSITFPPIFSSSFDRQLFILKLLHEGQWEVNDLADHLWMGVRTIEADIAALKGNDDSIRIMGNVLVVEGMERRSKKLSFQSTVHPLFLTPNLTQVVVMLQGLKVMENHKVYRVYARRLAVNIWTQLSDYGRKRILIVTGLLSLDESRYRELDQNFNSSLFATEEQCSYRHGAENVMDYLKNGKECVLEIMEFHGDRKILKKCIIKGLNENWTQVTIQCEEEHKIISLDSILSVGESEELLY
ncbi:MAG: hypothetical protein CVV25_09770 [Ignavibacteriae bacterium HGW-Ignavibacteriae-4]|jgi:hypothetical protein|nr:MAG: hypothetical protein CVV25_09770 [Ignavibacteriae bacterium HGW-Ignavibacteriae-4]